MDRGTLRHDWTREEVRTVYDTSLLNLLFEAQAVHRQFFRPGDVQGCMLLSIKTGACPEDCAYCPQSAHYDTGLERAALMRSEDALAAAERARRQGATRFCMGAAWRSASNGTDFERVLEMVRGARALGMEACCT